MVRTAVVFCTLLAFASAFLEHARLDPIPEKFKDQEGCYIKELETMVGFGNSIPSKARCVEYQCSQDLVTIAGCGVAATRPPCYISEHKENPYPACCPRIICP